MNWRLRWMGFFGVASLMLFSMAGEGSPTESLWDDIYKSAWAGIYTNDQAVRGEAAYRANCALCHGALLEGTDDGPPLSGRDFAEDWDCLNMADLFEKIQFTMPANRPGRLSDNQVADILSYILKTNRFPAGSRMLPLSVDDLRGVRYLAQNPSR